MRKIVLVCMFTVGITGAFAQNSGLGIGIVGDIGVPSNYGGGLSLKIPSVPIYWTINGGSSGLYVAGDMHFLNGSIIPTLLYFVGAGAFAGLGLWNSAFTVGVGVRGVAGLSWQPIDLIEVFVQAVPSLGVQIGSSTGLWENFLSGNIGLRIWL
ncbi:MAG: hypothetical protein LBQ77_04430 [Treponema sp.]|jgi:hypothetical protein|nr:hypothetical protein [Treponema sp.]